MRFSEYVYERPDMEALKTGFEAGLNRFEGASAADGQQRALEALNSLRKAFESMAQICMIRHTVDTNNGFYEEEQTFFDENGPIYEGLVNRLYDALLESPFRADLEDRLGSQVFRLAEKARKVYSDEIVEDLVEENRLATAYTKRLASAQIDFMGKKHTLSELKPYQISLDRSVRKAANEAKYAFMAANGEAFDDLYDRMVKVRTRMARKLGYDTFIPMGYDRMLRTDYGPDQVAGYRESIRTHLVPLAAGLKERQRKRLGVETLFHWDEPVFYPDGNARPAGDHDFLVDGARRMYRELSPETGAFFDFMLENGLMDLKSKPGKSPGGYCTYIASHRAPFIFSNFNGTTDDVDVLTHEAGHAFQSFMSRSFDLPEYNFPTLEACEIHSMSMEFITWPWMDIFFGADADKYRYDHLSRALMFIPYGAAVDEFQHLVYSHPEASPARRRDMWRAVERTYLPHRAYGGHPYLESGGFWHQQGHIFKNPFYYIDYTLAQVCAFQYWRWFEADRAEAWRSYAALCRLGGSRSFLELVAAANLASPFEEETLVPLVKGLDQWLKNASFEFLKPSDRDANS